MFARNHPKPQFGYTSFIFFHSFLHTSLNFILYSETNFIAMSLKLYWKFGKFIISHVPPATRNMSTLMLILYSLQGSSMESNCNELELKIHYAHNIYNIVQFQL
jgi:hypothetical protein